MTLLMCCSVCSVLPMSTECCSCWTTSHWLASARHYFPQ